MKKILFLFIASIIGIIQSQAQTQFVSGDLIFRVTYTAEVEVCGYNNKNINILTIPSSVKYMGADYTVSAVGECGLERNNQLVSVTIPSTVIELKESAFAYCSNLQEVILNEGLQKIGNSAFGNCISLKEINIPATVTFIQAGKPQPSTIYGSFNDCNSLQAINVDPQNQDYTSIDGVLYDKNIENLYKVPSAIPSLNLPSSLLEIYPHSGEYCNKLTTITIPDQVTIIGDESFLACENVTDITIGDSVTEIGYGAFGSFGSCKLKNIKFGKSVQKIGAYSFFQTFSLENISFPKSLKEIGDYAFSGTGLKTISLPNSLKTLGINVFGKCGNLEHADLSESNIMLLSTECFSMCENLKSVKLPSSLQFLGDNVFQGCEELEIVQCEALNPPSCVNNTFENYQYDQATLQVPNPSLNLYQTTVPWSYFNHIVDYNYVAIASVSINAPYDIIQNGSTLQLTADIMPSNASSPQISWEVVEGKENLNINNSGLITTNNYGNAIIRATAYNAISSVQTEINILVLQLSITGPQAPITKGAIEELSADIEPWQDSEDFKILWSSSDDNIVSVDKQGKITAKSQGTATITASLEQYPHIKASYLITVSDILPQAIEFTSTVPSEMKIGETSQINVKVSPEGAGYSKLIWTSSDKNVATVSDGGLVTAVSEGYTFIGVSIEGYPEISNSFPLYVNSVSVAQIILNMEEAQLNVGGTLQLKATVLPENAKEKTVSWSTSNENVASVSSDGLVTAISEGSAKITASCGEFSATCEITVGATIIDAEQILLNIESAELNLGETVLLEATVLPENTTDQTIIWNSSDPNVSTVSDSGLVSALSVGTAIITVSCGEVSAECSITVLEDAGVENLLANPENEITIYSPDGILIKKDCKVEDLKTLNKGIYIIVSGKDRYKISL